MNCKQGDLAIYVRGRNAGMIVRCVTYVGDTPFDSGGCQVWLIDRPVPWYWTERGGESGRYPFASDHKLRPIRDTDKPDEIPTRVPEKAYR